MKQEAQTNPEAKKLLNRFSEYSINTKLKAMRAATRLPKLLCKDCYKLSMEYTFEGKQDEAYDKFCPECKKKADALMK